MPVWPLAATLAMQTLATMTLYSLPTVAPAVARDLGVSGTLVGGFVAMAYGVGIFSAVISPGVVRRFGGVRAAQMVLLAAAGMLAFAALGQGVGGLALSAFVLGLGYGAAATASTHLLVPQTPQPVFNLVMSLRQIGVPLGGVLAALLLPPLVLRIGWRGALAVQIVPILALMLAMQVPRAKWDADREPSRRVFGPMLWQPFLLLAESRFRRLSVAAFCYAGLSLCLVAFMTVQLTTVVRVNLVFAGQILAAYQIAGSVSRPIWGWIADRVLSPAQTMAVLGVGMAGATVATGFYGPGWPFWLLMANAVLAGATAGGYTGIAYAEYAALGGARRTEATGLGTAVMFFGGMAVPPVFGWAIGASGGYLTPCLVGGVCALVCGVAMALPFRGRGGVTVLVLACLLPGVAEAGDGWVVSSQHLASEAGVEMLRRGGNAVDAAVAVGYAEAVVNPCCGNIGGGGFLVAHFPDGRDVFLNFRETAPAGASRNMYAGAGRGASVVGWKAVAVPGTVLGLDTALVRYGKLSRAVVMGPAVRLARDGFVLGAEDAALLARGAAMLRHDPEAARIFVHPDGAGYRVGERLVQPDLAATLAAIAERGPDAFYRGRIPAAVQAASDAGGGVIKAADFAAYRVTEGEPLRCSYRGYEVESAPLPSSGGTTMCEALGILQGFDLRRAGFGSVETVHLLAEALRRAFLDRNTLLGDPAFISAPVGRLLSEGYLARLRASIGDRATPSVGLAAGSGEKAETTHYSVLDGNGMAVSVTFTINGGFGAGVVADSTGFLLNDEMDDFATAPGVPNMFGLVQGEANAVAPGKRPLSSMAPTVVLKDGKVAMVVGSPGGPRIISAVLETVVDVVNFGMDARAAVAAPRVHQQFLPDVLFAEAGGLTPGVRAGLERLGYRVEVQPAWGAVALIAADGAGGYRGAEDPRRPGGAAIRE